MILGTVLFDCSDNFLISVATTPKPLPASPALAASIAAFKPSSLVLSAISFIIEDTSFVYFDKSVISLIFLFRLRSLTCMLDADDANSSIVEAI